MNLQVVNVILGKELLETLRDKRTLIMMIAVPILLYPAMLFIGLQMALLQHSRLEETISKVAVQGPEANLLKGWLQGLPRIDVLDSANPGQDLADGRLDAILSADCVISDLLEANGSVPIHIQYDRTEFASRDALGRLRNVLDSIAGHIRAERLERMGLPESYIVPLAVTETDTALPEKTTGMLLGLLLPVLMIVMISMGAFYPAVDLTAGEKERGTFETLLATPISKLEIVTGKFIAVFFLAMLTGLLNLASMAATFLLLIKQLSSAVEIEVLEGMNLPLESFFVILIVLVPLAFFISAMMMSASVFARSFKEAQNYLMPVMIMIMLPATFAGFPGVKLGVISQFIPIANVVLLFKELMTGKAGFEETAMVFVSMAVYALLSLFFAAWIFQREDVVLSEQGGIPLSMRRSSFRARDALTPGSALILFSIIMLFLFYGGSLAQQWRPIPGLLITEWAFILLPTLAFLWFVRIRWRPALHLNGISAPALLGTLLIAGASIPLVIQLGVWHNRVLPFPKELQEALGNLFLQGDNARNLPLLLFVIAVSPAICEEVLFRGAILSGLRARLGVWGAIAVVGILFGLFHLSIYRFVPTGVLGVILTYLALRARSIYPAMIMHALVNGTSILLATGRYPTVLHKVIDPTGLEKNGLSSGVLGAAVIAFVLGLLVLELAHRAQMRRQPGTHGL